MRYHYLSVGFSDLWNLHTTASSPPWDDGEPTANWFDLDHKSPTAISSRDSTLLDSPRYDENLFSQLLRSPSPDRVSTSTDLSYAKQEAITPPDSGLTSREVTKTAPLGTIGQQIHLQRLATRDAFVFESTRRRQLPCAVPLLRRSNNERRDAREKGSPPTDDGLHLVGEGENWPFLVMFLIKALLIILFGILVDGI